MPDRFGALPLPLPAVTGPAGDPALDVLGSYLAAVLSAELGHAWAPLAPGRPVVRRVFPHSVAKRRFVKEDLPSLFLFRSGTGQCQQYTIDAYLRTQTVLVQWVFPPALNEHQTDRDPFVNAIGSVLERAINRGRHAAWVVPGDLAAPEGLVLPTPTSTQAVVLSGPALTGALASAVVQATRSVTLTTAPAKGAYTVGAPIGIFGFDAAGVPRSDTFTLSSPDGGETVPTFQRFAQVDQIGLPGMKTTAGRFSAGYAESPEAALGSLVMRYAGLFTLLVSRPAEVKPLLIAVKNPETRVNDAPMPFEMVELALSLSELLSEDPAMHYRPLATSLGGEGAMLDILAADESVLEDAELP
jgi:hypothetical protein